MTKYRFSQLARKKRKKFLTKMFLFFVLLILTFFCVSELLKTNSLNIKEISVKGDSPAEISRIDDLVVKELNGNYFWNFLPKRNIFFYPKNNIKKELLKQYPKIKEVSFNLNDINSLSINIKERKPFVLWCQKSEEISNDCFVVDEGGFIFGKSNGEKLFRYYSILKGKKIIRKNIFIPERFKEINSFVKFLEGNKLKPYKFVQEGGSCQIYFLKGKRIIFNESQSVRTIMDNLQSVMNMKDFNLRDVSYVDLRFGNKVFYK